MKNISVVAITVLCNFLPVNCNAADFPQNWICIVDSAAGTLYNQSSKQYVPSALNFQEEHKRFTLNISRTDLPGILCKQSVDHYNSIISRNGHLDYSPVPSTPDYSADPSKFWDYSVNIGPHCFSTTTVVQKFFDRNLPTNLYGYDFLPTSFSGLPGQWLILSGSFFQAGELLDGGPVVYTGTCNLITGK